MGHCNAALAGSPLFRSGVSAIGPDTSIERDRQKAGIYAAAGVTEYWILNLVQSQLEQYTQAGDGRYDKPAIRHANEIVSLDVGETTLQLELSKLLEP